MKTPKNIKSPVCGRIVTGTVAPSTAGVSFPTIELVRGNLLYEYRENESDPFTEVRGLYAPTFTQDIEWLPFTLREHIEKYAGTGENFDITLFEDWSNTTFDNDLPDGLAIGKILSTGSYVWVAIRVNKHRGDTSDILWVMDNRFNMPTSTIFLNRINTRVRVGETWKSDEDINGPNITERVYHPWII